MALSDECDIIVLTSETKEAREAAQRLKTHFLELTKNPFEEERKKKEAVNKLLPKHFRR